MNNSYTAAMRQTAADFNSLGKDLDQLAGTLEARERYNPREELYKLFDGQKWTRSSCGTWQHGRTGARSCSSTGKSLKR